MVSFEDFKKLELVTAKVLEVRDHPNADKLYVLTIDNGDKKETASGEKNVSAKREIVAGIKGAYPKEELVGKNIVIIENLEPAVIRGVRSCGMLLAAQDGDTLSLIVPEKEIKPGSKVR